MRSSLKTNKQKLYRLCCCCLRCLEQVHCSPLHLHTSLWLSWFRSAATVQESVHCNHRMTADSKEATTDRKKVLRRMWRNPNLSLSARRIERSSSYSENPVVPYDSAVPVSGMYPRELRTHLHRTCIQMFAIALSNPNIQQENIGVKA